MLRNSNNGIINKIFLTNKNKIFLTEDQNGIGIFHRLFEKHLTNERRTDLFILSSKNKENAIEIFFKLKEKNLNKKISCLVDLDFDDYLGKNKIIDPHFFYLKKYTLENYFVNETVGIRLLASRNSTDFDKAKAKLNFEYWKEEIGKDFKEIIALFLTIQKLNLTIPNAKCGSGKFFESTNRCTCCPGKSCSSRDLFEKKCDKKIRVYKNSINENLSSDIIDLFQEEKDLFTSSLNHRGNVFYDIPGKQLMKLYSNYLNSLTSKRIDEDAVKDNGIQHCSELDKIILEVIDVLYN